MAIRTILYQDKTFELSYERRGDRSQKSILILHGWGSNKEIMLQALDRHFHPSIMRIYLDLPGFGKSPNDHTPLTTHDYKQIVSCFLQEIDIKPDIVIGHSFGGKIATLMQPACLVLLSSAGIPVPKPLSVRFKITLFKMLKPLRLQKLRDLFVSKDAKGMSVAMYETFKNVVDEDFTQYFHSFRGKALLFWGKGDTATPLWTAHEIQHLIGDSTLYPLEGDHFFFANHGSYIVQMLQQACYGEEL